MSCGTAKAPLFSERGLFCIADIIRGYIRFGIPAGIFTIIPSLSLQLDAGGNIFDQHFHEFFFFEIIKIIDAMTF